MCVGDSLSEVLKRIFHSRYQTRMGMLLVQKKKRRQILLGFSYLQEFNDCSNVNVVMCWTWLQP